MAKVSLATIKNWFISGFKPTQSQFWDTWDSFRHKDDTVPAAEVSGLDALLAGKAEATHTTNPNAHADIVATLRDEMTMAGLSAQLLEITLPPEEVVDPASTSLIEKLNAWMTISLAIQEDTLIYVRYWHSELSDGDAATIRTWALFMLEPGTYGPGGQPIPNVKVINDLSFGPELEISTRRVKLSTIPALTQAGGSSIGTQDQFNKRVDEILININNKAPIELVPASASWFFDGVTIEIKNGWVIVEISSEISYSGGLIGNNAMIAMLAPEYTTGITNRIVYKCDLGINTPADIFVSISSIELVLTESLFENLAVGSILSTGRITWQLR